MEVIVRQLVLAESRACDPDESSSGESDALVSPESSPFQKVIAFSSGFAYVVFASILWFFLPLLNRPANNFRRER